MGKLSCGSKHQMLFSSLVLLFCLSEVLSLPSSMVEEIKAKEMTPNKVKRVSLPVQNSEENFRNENHFHDKPTAIKRGVGIKSLEDDSASIDDWSSGMNDYQSPLFNNEENADDWKNLKDYEKGLRYGMNRDNNMDEALENAVLKSELYESGFSRPSNQYRYNNMMEDERRRRRKKRNSREFNYRNQDDLLGDLTPEETRALLNLYENEAEINDLEQDDDTWLEIPVRPRLRYSGNNNNPKYLEMLKSPSDTNNFRQSKWDADAANHFMSKKKTEPATRGLLEQFWTNPGPKYKRDYYTLSQLLSNQREPNNVPVFHRYVL